MLPSAADVLSTPSVQISDKIDPSDLVSMIAAFNPDNVPGRLAVVVRMGAAKVRSHLPRLIDAVQRAGQVRMLNQRASAIMSNRHWVVLTLRSTAHHRLAHNFHVGHAPVNLRSRIYIWLAFDAKNV